MALRPAHTTPVGDGPLGVGQKSQCPEAPPQVTGVRHVVCLELLPVGVETLEE